MNICIIGGLGFCGSHLCDALKAAGHWVTVIDNDSGSSDRHSSGADVIYIDDASRNLHHYNNRRFDYVFHCASPSGPARIAPGYALDPIIQLTKAGLDFAQQTGARFVKFSTSEVYGRSDVPLTETTPAIISPAYDARSEYSIGFIAAECMCFTHPHHDVQVLRLFNVVGPRQSAKTGAVLPRMIEQAKANEPITIIGSGLQKRAFLDVSDLVSFCLLLMEHWPNEKATWNVANPANAVSIGFLASLINQLADNNEPPLPPTSSGIPMFPRPRIEFIDGGTIWPHYRDGIEKCDISIEKARSIGWEPKVGLKEIIQKCL